VLAEAVLPSAMKQLLDRHAGPILDHGIQIDELESEPVRESASDLTLSRAR